MPLPWFSDLEISHPQQGLTRKESVTRRTETGFFSAASPKGWRKKCDFTAGWRSLSWIYSWTVVLNEGFTLQLEVFFFFLIFIYLAALGLSCGMRASLQLWPMGSRACRLSMCGTWMVRGLSYPSACRILVPQHRDWTCVTCIGRCILNHWNTREAHFFSKAMIQELSLGMWQEKKAWWKITQLDWDNCIYLWYKCEWADI